MSEIFEQKEPVENTEQEIQPVEQPKPKKGKHKKPMSDERRAKLSEQLKKARLISQQKRGAASKLKKLKKLKELESEVLLEETKEEPITEPKEEPITETLKEEPITEALKEPINKKKIKVIDDDIETRIEKRLRLKLEKEYANTYDHKLKDYKILSLQERLSDYKQTKKLEIIKEEKIKDEPKPKVVDNISPMSSRNLMDKYRRIRGNY